MLNSYLEFLHEASVEEAGGRVAKLRKTTSSLAAAGGYANPAWLAYRAVRGAYDICTKKCGKYELNTTRRQHCMAQCKAKKTGKAKHQATYQKSKRSFTDRGADLPER